MNRHSSSWNQREMIPFRTSSSIFIKINSSVLPSNGNQISCYVVSLYISSRKSYYFSPNFTVIRKTQSHTTHCIIFQNFIIVTRFFMLIMTKIFNELQVTNSTIGEAIGHINIRRNHVRSAYSEYELVW